MKTGRSILSGLIVAVLILSAISLYAASKSFEQINSTETYSFYFQSKVELSEEQKAHAIDSWHALQTLSSSASPRQVISAANNFIKTHSDFGPAFLIRAEAHQQIHATKQAKQDFSRAIQDKRLFKKDRLRAEKAMYYLLTQEGNTTKATPLIKRLSQQNPSDIELVKQLSASLTTQKKYQEAEQTWKRIPQLTKNKTEVAKSHAARASLLERMGKANEAMSALRLANVNKTSALPSWDARLRFARLYINAKKPAQALYHLTNSSGTLLPKEEVENNQQGISYSRYLQSITRLTLELKRYSFAITALEELNRSATHPGEKAKWLILLAETAEKNRKLDASLQYYERALILKENTNTRIRAANVAWELKKYSSVSRLLKPAIESSNDSPQSEQLGLNKRVCDALSKEGKATEALRCIDPLVRRNPQNQSLLLLATSIAKQAKDTKAQREYLKAANNLVKPSQQSLSIGYKQASKTKNKKSQQWFKKAYKQEQGFKAGYAYANSLLRDGKRDSAIILLSRLVKSPNSTSQDKHHAYQSLGYAMASNGDFHGAATSWASADKLIPNPSLRVRRIWALYKGGYVKKASRLLSSIPLSTLSKRDQLTWYELRGTIRFLEANYQDSLTAREHLVTLSPTAKHWAQLAETYVSLNKLEKADKALENAIAKSRGNNTRYVLKRASLKNSTQHHESATILLTQALQNDPKNPVIQEELGRAYAALHMNRQAIIHLRKAVNSYQAQAISGTGNTSKIINKRNELTQQIAQLNRGLQLSLVNSGSLKSSDLSPSTANILAPFNHSGGAFEISYQPKNFGYNDGRLLRFFARAIWNNRNNGFGPDGRTLSPTVGFKYKPIGSQNLWFSMEKIFKSGSDSVENILIQTSWMHTKGNRWPFADTFDNQSTSSTYQHFQLNVGKLLEDHDPLLAFAEARYGKTWLLSDNWLASPFLYIRGDSESGTASKHLIDGGFGITARYRNAYDFYEGYKINNEVYFRLGTTLDSSEEKEEVQATVGLKFSY